MLLLLLKLPFWIGRRRDWWEVAGSLRQHGRLLSASVAVVALQIDGRCNGAAAATAVLDWTAAAFHTKRKVDVVVGKRD